MAKVKKSVEDLEYTRAMSSVLTFMNGKHSFLYKTYEKVLSLKDKHV